MKVRGSFLESCPSFGFSLYGHFYKQHQAFFIYIDKRRVCGMIRTEILPWVITRYWLDGPGIESRLGDEIFRTRPDWPWGLPSLLYNGHRGFPGSKAAGAWRWTPTPSSTEVKERVELYLYSPYGPSWPVLGWPLPLSFTLWCKGLC